MKFQELDISSQAEQRRNYWKQKVEQCPPDMMAREFIQNGIEAPAGSSEKSVIWEPYEYEGVTKLSVVNTGAGMPVEELCRLADMAWSGDNKTQGRTGNKGIGARVAGLRNNKHGVVYFSCCSGRVYKIRLCYNPEIDGYGAEKLSADSIALDVTSLFTASERSSEWVRVVFLGNSRDAETVKKVGDQRRNVGWLSNEIFYRYFRIRGAVVSVSEQLTPRHKDNSRTAITRIKTCSEWFDNASAYDAVYLDGATIHYAHFGALDSDDRRTTVGPAMGVASLGAVAWRGEFYDLSNGSAWRDQAKHFGIPFVAHSVCVVVELDDASHVFPTEYRDQIYWDVGDLEGKPVRMRRYEAEVVANRPQWLIALIEEKAKRFRRDQSKSEEKVLLSIWNRLHMIEEVKVTDSTGDDLGADSERMVMAIHEDHKSDVRRIKRERSVVDGDGSARASRKMANRPLPKFIFCWDDSEVEEANIQTWVAYYEAAGEVYVNMQHPIVCATRKSVRASIMAKRKGAANEAEIEAHFRASCESFVRQNLVALIAAAGFNSTINPAVSRLQALSDEGLSAVFGLLELPANLEAIKAGEPMWEAA